MNTTQLTEVFYITVNRSSVRACIVECKSSLPHKMTIDFASASLIPTGSYLAEWQLGDQLTIGMVTVDFVLFSYLKQGIYLYGGSFWIYGSSKAGLSA